MYIVRWKEKKDSELEEKSFPYRDRANIFQKQQILNKSYKVEFLEKTSEVYILSSMDKEEAVLKLEQGHTLAVFNQEEWNPVKEVLVEKNMPYSITNSVDEDGIQVAYVQLGE